MDKTSVLQDARTHITKVRSTLKRAISDTEQNIKDIDFKIKNPPKGVEAHVAAQHTSLQMTNMAINIEKLDTLGKLEPSPYFMRCEVKFDGAPAKQNLYFAKGTFLPEQLFSWIVPAAKIRFEPLGRFTFTLPSGHKQSGELFRKDQFMIVDGDIVFMSSESTAWERQLVYQEYLSNKKNGFVLQEIVAVMEKAQDAVIRAHHKGSFLISGPAGSGKTTLALHRVAYLTQSPETAQLYKAENIIVFVQDESTKAYFAGILPELGINNVHITTFSSWALELMRLTEYQPVTRYGADEQIRDSYEFEKHQALEELTKTNAKSGLLETLQQLYKKTLSAQMFELFNRQLQEKKLDRFDITILLKIHYNLHKKLTRAIKTFAKTKVKTKFKEVFVDEAVNYSLMIIDEVQNYIPDQINLLRTCINSDTNALLYVGDLAQQTQIATVRNWTDVGEQFSEGRQVQLQKVYRNTQQILKYIQQVGYNVEVPKELKEGPEVQEIIETNTSNYLQYIAAISTQHAQETVGIITKTPEFKNYLLQQSKFKDKKGLHIVTINESQGVEFDCVILAIQPEDFIVNKDLLTEEQAMQKTKIHIDLLYVALTRAMSTLHVITPVATQKIYEKLRGF